MKIGRLFSGGLVRVCDGRAALLDYGGDLRSLLADGREPGDLEIRSSLELDELMLTAPLRPGKIVAIGRNYLDHCREINVDPPDAPLVFAKFPSSVIGPGETIVVDRSMTESVDWEAELGVVISKKLRRASVGEAAEGIYGYTVVNDVSARDIQGVRGKSFETFCPVGPWVVTTDDIQNPQGLKIWTDVNGTRMQDSSTSEMIFGVAELLAYCSHSFTLEPGDLVITGTPSGVGNAREPRVFLSAGDVITVGIEKIGEVTNRLVDLT